MPDSRTPPDVAALAREALELCDRRPPELLYLREDVRMTELLRDLARAVLDREGADCHHASEQQVATAWDKTCGGPEHDVLTAPIGIAWSWLSALERQHLLAFARALTAGAPAEDTARLDWLETGIGTMLHPGDEHGDPWEVRRLRGSVNDREWEFRGEGPTLRAALDAARSVSPAGDQTQEPRDG